MDREPDDQEEEDFLRFRARSGSNVCWTEDELFEHISATEQFKKLLRRLYDKKILDVHEIINITGIVPDKYYLKGKYFHVDD